MWSCDTCGRPNHRNPLICATCGAAAPGADATEVSLALQRDLPMESHLRALAFWYRLGAVLFGSGALALIAFLGRAVGLMSLADRDAHGRTLLFAGTFGWVAMVIVAAVVGSWVLGHYLGRFANGARLAAAILTIVGLAFGLFRFIAFMIVMSRLDAMYAGLGSFAARPSLAGPIAMFLLSTIWSIAMIVTLLSGRAAQVCAPAYRTIVARTSAMKASLVKTPYFVVPLVATVLVAMMLLRLAFELRGFASL